MTQNSLSVRNAAMSLIQASSKTWPSKKAQSRKNWPDPRQSHLFGKTRPLDDGHSAGVSFEPFKNIFTAKDAKGKPDWLPYSSGTRSIFSSKFSSVFPLFFLCVRCALCGE